MHIGYAHFLDFGIGSRNGECTLADQKDMEGPFIRRLYSSIWRDFVLGSLGV